MEKLLKLINLYKDESISHQERNSVALAIARRLKNHSDFMAQLQQATHIGKQAEEIKEVLAVASTTIKELNNQKDALKADNHRLDTAYNELVEKLYNAKLTIKALVLLMGCWVLLEVLQSIFKFHK